MNDEGFQYYIDRLWEEDSFFALIEAGEGILPRLETQFHQETRPAHRAALIEIIWYYRNTKSLAILAEALADASEPVWQEALNGLVTIGGEGAQELLRAALPAADKNKQEWINEAIAQVREYKRFVVEDRAHADVIGEYAELDEALAELRRRAAIPWNEPPNRTPCSEWATCRREYQVCEVAGTQIIWEELRCYMVLEVSPAGVKWAKGFEP